MKHKKFDYKIDKTQLVKRLVSQGIVSEEDAQIYLDDDYKYMTGKEVLDSLHKRNIINAFQFFRLLRDEQRYDTGLHGKIYKLFFEELKDQRDCFSHFIIRFDLFDYRQPKKSFKFSFKLFEEAIPRPLREFHKNTFKNLSRFMKQNFCNVESSWIHEYEDSWTDDDYLWSEYLDLSEIVLNDILSAGYIYNSPITIKSSVVKKPVSNEITNSFLVYRPH